MRGAAGRARGILRRCSGTSDLVWRYVLNARPTFLYRLRERPLRGEAARVLRDLNRDGVALTSIAALFADDGRLQALQAAAEDLQDRMAESLATAREAASDSGAAGKKPFVVALLGDIGPRLAAEAPRPTDLFARYPLQDPISRIADAYFGMYARLHHYNLWRNFATRLPARESQLWHRDPMPEDRFVLKVFTCLTDVDDGSGPFVYAAGTHRKGGVRQEPDFLHKDGQTPRSDDDQMARVVPPAAWVRGVGRAGTIIFADTRGYHRGGLARERDRLLHVGVFRPPGLRDGGLCTSRYRSAAARASS